jgi:hypothetical protein
VRAGSEAQSGVGEGGATESTRRVRVENKRVHVVFLFVFLLKGGVFFTPGSIIVSLRIDVHMQHLK